MTQTFKTNGGGGNNSQQNPRFAQNFSRGLKSNSLNQKQGFTLAETLITLAIIGVVAALTIPSLITKYQKHQYVTQLKKNYNILSNGFKTILAKDGVTKLSDTTLWRKMPSYYFSYEWQGGSSEEQEFFAELSKTFSIISTQSPSIAYKSLDGGLEEERGNGIILKDGTIIYYYFVKNWTDLIGFDMPYNKGYMIIDTNGTKSPNQWGRDLFKLYIYNDKIDAGEYIGGCELNAPFKGDDCAARIIKDGWQMKY